MPGATDGNGLTAGDREKSPLKRASHLRGQGVLVALITACIPARTILG